MAAVDFRANLSAKAFPFLSSQNARTVIAGNRLDQVYNRYTAKAETDEDLGTPQVFYGHNFIPTQEGYASIARAQIGTFTGWQAPNPSLGYRPQIFPVNIPVANFIAPGTVDDKTFPALITLDGLGNFWFAVPTGASYAGLNTLVTPGLRPNEGIYMSVAVLNGRSFIGLTSNYNSSGGPVPAVTYELNSTGISLVTLTGLDYNKLRGVVASNGYLLAWTRNSIAWSSLLDPTDFVPSTITGAGGGAVQECKGQIHKCVSAPFGFILYCQDNCVAAVYTGNSRFPFKFNEIAGAGGFVAENLITEGGTLAGQIAYTTAGLQRLTQDAAYPYLAALSDFIRNGNDEDFNVTTGVFTKGSVGDVGTSITNTGNVLNIPGRLTLIGNRYLFYSYTFGVQPILPSSPAAINVTHQEYTHALIYDVLLDRWGKFRDNHVDIFELNTNVAFPIPGAGVGKVYPRLSIGYMNRSGIVYSLYTSIYGNAQSADSCVILGKYQLQRGYRTILHKITSQGPTDSYDESKSPIDNYSVRVFPYQDGYTPGALVTPNLISNNLTGYQKIHGLDLDAESFAILVSGAFHLTSLEMSLSRGGRI